MPDMQNMYGAAATGLRILIMLITVSNDTLSAEWIPLSSKEEGKLQVPSGWQCKSMWLYKLDTGDSSLSIRFCMRHACNRVILHYKTHPVLTQRSEQYLACFEDECLSLLHLSERIFWLRCYVCDNFLLRFRWTYQSFVPYIWLTSSMIAHRVWCHCWNPTFWF